MSYKVGEVASTKLGPVISDVLAVTVSGAVVPNILAISGPLMRARWSEMGFLRLVNFLLGGTETLLCIIE